MIELRWVEVDEIPENDATPMASTKRFWPEVGPQYFKLQYRQQVNGFVGGYDPEKPMPFVPTWTAWQDVPSAADEGGKK